MTFWLTCQICNVSISMRSKNLGADLERVCPVGISPRKNRTVRDSAESPRSPSSHRTQLTVNTYSNQILRIPRALE